MLKNKKQLSKNDIFEYNSCELRVLKKYQASFSLKHVIEVEEYNWSNSLKRKKIIYIDELPERVFVINNGIGGK